MIRINLLKDVGGGVSTYGSAGPDSATAVTQSAEKVEGGDFQLLLKLGVLLVPGLFIYFYNSYTDFIGQRLNNSLNQEITAVQEKMKTYEPGLKDIEKFQEEKRKLDEQLSVIRELSKERLKNVKAMDKLQEIIPQKAWIVSFKINGNKVDLDGFASDDIVIAEFMKSLEESIYFANVALESSSESKRDEGVMKRFVIKCNLENI